MSNKCVFLREAITERLTLAAEEIFGTVEQIVTGYREELTRAKHELSRSKHELSRSKHELSRSKQETERLRRLMSIKPVLRLHRTTRTDPDLIITSPVCEEEPHLPEKLHCDQRTSSRTSPPIKQEQYLCTSQAPDCDFRDSMFSSGGDDDLSSHHHAQLHQTLTEERREQHALPSVGHTNMHPHGADPHQLFSHPVCEDEEDEEEVPEQDWSPGLEQENLQPPHIKEERDDLWASQEEPPLLRFNTKHTTLSPPCPGDQDPHLHRSQTDQNRERRNHPLPPDTAADIQMFPDGGGGGGGDNGESQLTIGCSFWEKHMPTQVPIRAACAYQCKYCSKCYISKEQLIRHERLHTVKKTYQCKYCGRWYIRKSALNRHERTHTGSDQHECKVCGKRFNYTGDLNRHELVHTGVKPYGCTFCNRCFSQKSNLKRHELVHKSHSS